MLVLHTVYKVHVFTVYMFHSNTVYKVQCSLCTCSTPILCSLQTSLTEHIHACLSAAYISHSISYMRLVIYSMLVLWTDYNCSVSVFYTTQHIPCQYLCSVLHHSAYSMSVSMQCSGYLCSVLLRSAHAMSASVSMFCTARHVPCQHLCQCSAPLSMFHVCSVCSEHCHARKVACQNDWWLDE